MKENKLTILSVCVLVLCANTVLADDVFVPGWRGTEGTVVATCNWWSQQDENYDGIGSLGIGPETNPGWPGGIYQLLFPQWARYHNGYYHENAYGRQNVVEFIGDGDISFGLPNYEGGFQKLILIQVTWRNSGPAGSIYIWDSEFDPNDFPWPQHSDARTLLPLKEKVHDDGWVTTQFAFVMEPNPSYEAFKIGFPADGSYVDQVVIDTICFSVPDDTKWQQLPDKNPSGIDIRVDRNDEEERILADDFLCTTTESIAHIRFWGSWFFDIKGNIETIHLGIYDDIPAEESPYGYSMPGRELWSMDITDFEEELYLDLVDEWEWWWDIYNGVHKYGDQQIWQYDIYIDPNDAFLQRGTFDNPLVYWLGVYVETDGTGKFGWKTSDPNDGHFNDDAVYLGEPNWIELTYFSGHLYYQDSIDMAFALTAAPHMDLGDAPDSSNSYDPCNPMTAYPGVEADFPTVYVAGSPPYGPIHHRPKSVAYLGSDVSYEYEADILADEDNNNNIDPPGDNSDNDGADDGISSLPDLPYCRWTTFDYDVKVINAGVDLYANVWFDFNRDGDWGDTLECSCCSAGSLSEWAVKNQLLYNLPAGDNTVATPAFRSWHPDPENPENIWMRITLSEQRWTFDDYALDPNGVAGSGPAAGYQYGETEDYLYTPDTTCIECANLNCDGIVDLEDFAIFALQWLQDCG